MMATFNGLADLLPKTKQTNPTSTGDKTMSKTSETTNICQCLTITSEDEHVIHAGTCGQPVKNRFAPGHDARTKGTLQKAFRTDREIISAKVRDTAQDWAKVYGYERYLTPKPASPHAEAVRLQDWRVEAEERQVGRGYDGEDRPLDLPSGQGREAQP